MLLQEQAPKYEEALQWLDGFLEKSMWVAGQQMTIADFSIIANIATAEVHYKDDTKIVLLNLQLFISGSWL